MPKIGTWGKIATASVTRPNDTTAYAAGDAVTDSTSAPTVMTFSSAARINAGTGTIIGAVLIDSANQSTKGDFDLFIFDTTYTPDNDNAAFTPTDAELQTCLAVISFTGTTAKTGDATSGAGGNCIYPSAVVNPIEFQTLSGSQNLYGALVARNAYTPVANEVFTVRLRILQD